MFINHKGKHTEVIHITCDQCLLQHLQLMRVPDDIILQQQRLKVHSQQTKSLAFTKALI